MGGSDGLVAGARFADDGQVGFGLEHAAQAVTDDGVVVDQQDADHARPKEAVETAGAQTGGMALIISAGAP
ncbi:hypothetical protein GCM10009827_045340 [Dactylosporangium maewongense]|uniref:Uncharacterized protein n=1 Tax=Dactylosporangium maewongense TaxID=634393 RepID=A0ABN2AS53_9ACTN